MRVPFLDLKAQHASIRDEVRAAVDGVLDSQQFILGPNVAALEREVAAYSGAAHAVGVASGTDALLVSLRALGVGPGDAVVTVPYTFFATAGAIANLGARPLFVDVEPSGYNMDPALLARLLERECRRDPASRGLVHASSGARLRAVVPVHLYGQCADMAEIAAAARRYELAVVEDCAQAIGARYQGGRAGTFGDAGALSFFPSKNLGGAGDGGMILTRDAAAAERMRLLRTHGARPKYFHAVVGFNSRLDELQAAILRVKLRHLDAWLDARRRNAEIYRAAFERAGLSDRVVPPVTLPGREHSFHQYVIACDARDALRDVLRARGVDTEIYYPLSLHQQECFAGLGYAAADFPCSVRAASRTLALPIFPELTPEQIDYVVSSISDFYASARRVQAP